MSYRHNAKQETLTANGLRDVPVKQRPKFEKLIKETFSKNETPVSFEYSRGYYPHEGKIFKHKLEVVFMYWDGYQLATDMVNFLQ